VINNYNRNASHIHNTYVNYRAPRALTAVPATAFVHGQPVGRFAQKVDPAQWRNARINPGAPGIAPVRESFAPGQRNANYRPPAGVMTRPVVATRNPSMPPAYRDGLAQRFAQSGGRVPGAGQPIARTSVPAHMGSGPGALPAQNVRIVQSHLPGRTPGAAAGAPVPQPLRQLGPGAPNGEQQAGHRTNEAPGMGQPQRGGQPQARPGVPPQIANGQQPGVAGRPSNGVPRPPQSNEGNAGFARERTMPQQAGEQHGPPPAMNGRHEPAWTQPHAPMAQQAQQSGQRGGAETQAPQAGSARGADGQPNAVMMQRGVPRPVENTAMARQPAHGAEVQAPQQGRQESGEQSAQRSAAQQQPHDFHVQPAPQLHAEARPQPQAQQPPRQEFHPRPAPQPRAEARPQPQAQQPPRQEFHPQPRPEPRPPPQAQQPHPQPQPQPPHGDQHPGGGRDEHHRG
jgi:hypothetical protein